MTDSGNAYSLGDIDEWVGRPIAEEAWHTLIDGRGKEYLGVILESFGIDTFELFGWEDDE